MFTYSSKLLSQCRYSRRPAKLNKRLTQIQNAKNSSKLQNWSVTQPHRERCARIRKLGNKRINAACKSIMIFSRDELRDITLSERHCRQYGNQSNKGHDKQGEEHNIGATAVGTVLHKRHPPLAVFITTALSVHFLGRLSINRWLKEGDSRSFQSTYFTGTIVSFCI